MDIPQVYQYFKRTIAAGEVIRINAYGNFLTLLNSTGAEDILISISGQSFQEMPQGLSLELPQGDSFVYLEFRNSEAGPVTIKFSLSNGKIFDNRVTISGTLDVTETTNAINTPAAVAVEVAVPGAATIAANANRREILIQNNGANPIWVGDANVDGANNRGIKIDIGGSIILASEAALYLRSTVGASTASYMEMTK